MSDRYMMATIAHTFDGRDISRDKPDLAIIYDQVPGSYVGEWATGFGFINVRFPIETTHPLTDAEKDFYRGKRIAMGGTSRPILIDEEGE